MEKEGLSKTESILFERIAGLIEQSMQYVKTAINTAMVYTYYNVGKYIVENEQDGKHRAAYGQSLLKELSIRLSERFGDGWSAKTLEKTRQFYRVFQPTISSTARRKLLPQNSNSLHSVEEINPFTLSWSHYQILMRIKNDAERRFYEIECKKQDWSVRQLQRQYASSLYERLALSRDKKEVMCLSKNGQTIEKPDDVIKNPLTLEFLGLKPDRAYSETKLESAIIDKMQDFLLELGKGFLFEARQKRFTFDEEHFYVDLVLYNRLLQCYCLVDLKMDKLTHQDLGQMQMYVNYFDRYVKQDFEKPTIGILLCKKKSDALVNLTLPKDANIYAPAYELYLPDKTLLQTKVKEWIDELEENSLNKATK